MTDPGLQGEPVEDGHDDASDGDKVAGIVEQTRADVAQGNVDDVRDALAQRLREAGLEVSHEEFDAILRRVTD
jgi:hypothetical protein